MVSDKRYQAFGDDSGGFEAPERYLVMAAYALPAEKWKKFSDDWDIALKKPPTIEYLKMREAEGFEEQFQGMRSRPEFRDLKLNELSSVIREHKPYAMYAWVNRSDYDQVIRGRIPSEPDDPYFLAINGLIELCLMAQVRYDYWGPVDFVFDEQSNIKRQIMESFDHAKAMQPPHLQQLIGQTPVFRDDKKVLPIQAADMLAWHVRRRLERADELRSRMADLLAGGDCERQYDADEMRVVMSKWVNQFMKHIKQTRPDEYQNFDAMMGQLLKMPHSELKAKLDAEKAAKAAKRRKKSEVNK